MPDPLSYPSPALSDGRIGLREWRDDDVDCVRLASADPAITTTTSVPAAYTNAEGLAFVHRQRARAADGQGLSLAIVEVTDDLAVGQVWLARRPQERVGGLGYWVVPPARGRGVAAAAVRLAVPWVLSTWELQRLEAWVEPDNLASQAVLRGAGFVEEGRLRNFLTIAGSPRDALVFSVVPG